MTRDYGQRDDPRYDRIWMITRYTFVAMAIVMAVMIGGMGLRDQAGEKAYWDVKGPPCPVLGRAAFDAQAIRPNQIYNLDGVAFTRAFGWMFCAEQGPRRICQFTNPASSR